MRHSLNSLKVILGITTGIIKGETRSLDSSSYGLGFRV